MNRLCVILPPEQHQRQAVSTLRGKTVEGHLSGPTLPSRPEIAAADALCQLETFLKPRIEEAEREKVTSKSVEDIFEEVRQDRNGKA
uniref:Antitoxin ParD n=1 Tax=Candidatus Kentrum sp. LFY TaxID=2126342 RepID=A0A450WMQ6_9GAMM|nr:MAG: Antitoxin ParD [Candidatus Kentron sp. LFY]